DMTITKTGTPDPVIAGQNVTYTITVTNNGPSDAQAVAVNDVLPAGLTFVSATPLTGSWSAPNWTIGTLANSGEATLILVAKVNNNVANNSTIINTASVSSTTTDPVTLNNSASKSVNVSTSSDLSITKTRTPGAVIAGENVTFTVTVTNNGPSDAQDVVVNDVLPAGLTFVSATPLTGSWIYPNWTIGTLANSGTATMTLVAKVNSNVAHGSVVTNTASVFSTTSDPILANNSADKSVYVITSADLSIMKTTEVPTVIIGENVTYTITVTNNGPSDAQAVVANDVLPAGLTFVSATPSTGSWSAPYWTIGTLANTGTATMTLVAKVNNNVPHGTSIINTATVSSTTTDPTPDNNTSSFGFAAIASADLSITKTATPDPVIAGQNVTYTITVTNNGPSDAQAVVANDVLPAGLTFVSATPSTGSWTSPNWTIGTLANSGTATMTLLAKVNSDVEDDALITNNVSLLSITTDPVSGNNTSSATVLVYNPGISGVVYDDPNGLTDATINGNGSNASGHMYINLVSASNTVLTSLPVNADGTYFFGVDQGIQINSAYKIILSSGIVSVSSTLIAAVFPGNWVPTGEFLGTGSGNDGIPNGILSVSVLTSKLSNARFGTDELPTAIPSDPAPQYNPGGTNSVSIPAGSFNGTDPESPAGYILMLKIVSFPSNTNTITVNGNTYSSETWPLSGVWVPTNTSGNPIQAISIDPVDGSVTPVINFSVFDNAGRESMSSVALHIPFYSINLSGHVYNDVNGMNSGNRVDGIGIGTASVVPLFVSLTTEGFVSSTVAVSPEGTYTFSNLNSSLNYSVTLSTSNTPAGNPAPVSSLPAGWVNTGEILNNAANSLTGNDGLTTGILLVGHVTADAINANFGIEQAPLANSNLLPNQINPGGTNNLSIPASLFTGSDFSPGTITSIRVITYPTYATFITINGIAYNSGTFPLGGITIPANSAGNPSQSVTIDPVDGVVEVNISYVTVDNAGFSSSAATVSIQLFTIPTITCPANVVMLTDAGLCTGTAIGLTAACFDYDVLASLTWTMSGAGTASSTVTGINNLSNYTFNKGTSIVSYTVTNIHGYSASCSFSVIVNDNESPLINCPANIVVNNTAGLCSAVVSYSLTGTDNCLPPGITQVSGIASGSVFPLGTTSNSFLATDASGNTTNCSFTVTVNDNTAPSIVCPANISLNADAGHCNALVSVPVPVTADNCGLGTVLNSFSGTGNASGTYDVGTTTVIWTVTDIHSNTSTCSMTVTVSDQQLPAITCPANISVIADAGQCSALVTIPVPVTNDNCGVATLTNNFNSNGNVSGTYPVGTTTVIWTVTDIHSNTSTCSMTVTVSDQQVPAITCPANISVIADAGQCSALVTIPVPVTNDNCGVATLTNNFNSNGNASGTYPVGTTTVIWTVNDVHGNSSACSMSVTVTDNQAPFVRCPSNISVNAATGQCNAFVSVPLPVSSDNCGISSVLNNVNNSNNASGTYAIGTSIIIWTVTDIHGNSSTCSTTITVVDNQPPTIVCPNTLLLNTTQWLCTATQANLGTPVTSDNCGIASVVNNAPIVFQRGTTHVTWTVTDSYGNTASCNQDIVVIDSQTPAITCPAPVFVNAGAGSCVASNLNIGTPAYYDNCPGSVVTNNAPGTYPVGITTIVWTVVAANGQYASCSQLVTVIDNQSPTIVCPPAKTVYLMTGQCTASNVEPGTANSADNCGIATVTNNAPSAFPKGLTTVTWTVTDVNGISGSCSQIITVVDNIPPAIECPPAVNANTNAGTCMATGINIGNAVATDNCGVAVITNNAPASYPVGITTVSWIATDVSGYTAVCVQLVTITDNAAPLMACPADIFVNANPGICNATNVALGSPTVSDNCSGQITLTNNELTQYPLGITTVNWTATDIHGNTAVCSQQVTVLDNQAPGIVCPMNITIPANSGVCYASNVNPGVPITSDNCNGPLSLSSNAPAQFLLGTTTVIWTVTDAANHTASCSQLVTVVDQQTPLIIAQAAITVFSGTTSCTAANLILGNPLVTENCAILSVTNNAPSAYPVGVTTVVWVATDAAGNSAATNQIVIVIDTIPPQIVCPPDINALVQAVNCQSGNIETGSATVTDNCSVTSIINNAPAGFSLGTTTITWIATDASGNTSQCQQLVNVNDNTPPTVVCPATAVFTSNPGECSVSNVNIGVPTAS
ncbi:MAG: HYR domain-containing protein, partial [Bacteroidota bacterium]